MNKINQIVLRDCALLMASFWCWGTCVAQVAENAPKFPGSELPVAQAVDRSIIIATGVLLKLDPPIPTAPGQLSYEDVVFKVKKVLKGTCGGTVSMRVIVHPDLYEVTPVSGRKYILIVGLDEDERKKLLKCLPLRAQTLREVTAAIAGSH